LTLDTVIDTNFCLYLELWHCYWYLFLYLPWPLTLDTVIRVMATPVTRSVQCAVRISIVLASTYHTLTVPTLNSSVISLASLSMNTIHQWWCQMDMCMVAM